MVDFEARFFFVLNLQYLQLFFKSYFYICSSYFRKLKLVLSRVFTD